MEGLQGIKAMLSGLSKSIIVLSPILAQARAASQPACPPPATITSVSYTHLENAVQPEVGRVLSKIDGKVRNKSLSGGITELTIELVLHNNNTSFVDRIAQIDGVHSSVLV